MLTCSQVQATSARHRHLQRACALSSCHQKRLQHISTERVHYIWHCALDQWSLFHQLICYAGSRAARYPRASVDKRIPLSDACRFPVAASLGLETLCLPAGNVELASRSIHFDATISASCRPLSLSGRPYPVPLSAADFDRVCGSYRHVDHVDVLRVVNICAPLVRRLPQLYAAPPSAILGVYSYFEICSRAMALLQTSPRVGEVSGATTESPAQIQPGLRRDPRLNRAQCNAGC